MSAVLNIERVRDATGATAFRPAPAGLPRNVSARRKARFVRATPTLKKLSLTTLLPLDIVITELESGYSALAPIPIRIERVGDDYLASFNAANIHTSGETLLEAVRGIKSLILDVFDSLIAEQSALGTGPQRQLATLLQYVRKDSPQ